MSAISKYGQDPFLFDSGELGWVSFTVSDECTIPPREMPTYND